MRRSTKRKITIIILLFFISLAVYLAVPPVKTGTVNLKVQPEKIAAYVRINSLYIQSNVPFKNLSFIVLVYVSGNNTPILNKTIYRIGYIPGEHNIGKEVILQLPSRLANSMLQFRLIEVVDNVPYPSVSLGPGVEFNTTIVSNYLYTYPSHVNISYAVLGKGVNIRSNAGLSLTLTIIDKDFNKHVVNIDTLNKRHVDTPYYFRIEGSGHMGFFPAYYVDLHGHVFYRTLDNIPLFITAYTAISLACYVFISSQTGSGKTGR